MISFPFTGKKPLASAFFEEPHVLGQPFQPRTQVPAPCFPPREPTRFRSCAPAPGTRKRSTRAPLSYQTMPAQEPYLFSGNARQRRSPEHLATAIVTGRAFSQRHAAGPPPGSDHRHFFIRGTRRAQGRRGFPDVKEVVQAQG